MDPPYKTFLRSQSLMEIFLRKISKIDGQNPVIGSLVDKIGSKNVEENYCKKMQPVPVVSNLDLETRLAKIRGFNNRQGRDIDLTLPSSPPYATSNSDDDDGADSLSFPPYQKI